MAAVNACLFPIINQSYYLDGIILSNLTGNPITGGLTSLSATISKDGGAFASTTNTPVEIDTSGWFHLDLTATEMNAHTVAVQITATNTNAKYFLVVITPADLTQYAVAAGDQAVIRFEQYLLQAWGYIINRVGLNASRNLVLYKSDDVTEWLQGQGSSTDSSAIKPKLEAP